MQSTPHIHLVASEGRGEVQGGHVAGAGHARAVLVDILDTCQQPVVTTIKQITDG